MPRIRLPWRKILLWLIPLVVLGGAYHLWRSHEATPVDARYRTEPADVGDVTRTVTANGTLNPVTLVNVGTQVSGTVIKLYADFNDRVKAGEVLAELDPRLIQAQLAQDEASLASAQASLTLARENERRNRALYAKNYIARSDLDQTVQALEVAQAQVQAAQAQVDRDRTNLAYTIIRSPVSGVVVSRNVDLGQTVAASFQTPTLFQIANDLKHMQIDTSVAEADVGGVKVGQPVEFTVDAFPNRTFHGEVRQVRLNPTVQQNVVTYDVVVNVDNPEEILLPGMTAYVTIITDQRKGVLRVPNAALRFRPREAAGQKPPAPARDAQTVYHLAGAKLMAIPIRTGVTGSQYTEILGGDVKAGEPLVVEDLGPNAGQGGSRFRFGM